MAKLPVEKLKGSKSAKTAKPIPVKIVSEPSCSPDRSEDRKWKAQDALRDIQRAEGYKNDKALMKDVKALAKEQVSNLKKFC